MASKPFTLADGMTVAQRLTALSARSNKPFTCSLHPGIENILGLRVPDVRALAREIASGDWQAFLADPGDSCMEERMLHGLVLGQIKVADPQAYLRLVADFVPRINSWSVCDTFDFAGKHRFVARNSALVLDFLLPYLDSEAEYEVRFAVVMLMAHFLDPDHLDRVVNLLENVSHQGYYVRMAIAWALATAIARHPATMMARLPDIRLDKWTFNKTIQKALESRRTPADLRPQLTALRRR